MRAQSWGCSHCGPGHLPFAVCSPGFSLFSRGDRIKPGLHTSQTENCWARIAGGCFFPDLILTSANALMVCNATVLFPRDSNVQRELCRGCLVYEVSNVVRTLCEA